uniref:Uncharacterized protein n=1 Tax=Chelonoidis abingdonii TaxID=106734 RepID=A0A8C0IXY8_CHEAB
PQTPHRQPHPRARTPSQSAPLPTPHSSAPARSPLPHPELFISGPTLEPACTTHKFEHVPVEDIVVREALAVEEVTEELPQVRVVRFLHPDEAPPLPHSTLPCTCTCVLRRYSSGAHSTYKGTLCRAPQWVLTSSSR